MAATPRATRPAPDRYWQQRVRSAPFRRALTEAIRHELRWLAGACVGDVVDAELVRGLIREWDARVVDRTRLADLLLDISQRLEGRLKRHKRSLRDVLGAQFVADLDAVLEEHARLSQRGEEFVATLMRQEFVRGLFTDIIYASLVSFYEKVNPLFGAFAVRALEEQIKGFIRLFMPMVQERATAFAVDPDNQRIAFEFARSIVRQLLAAPLDRYATVASAGQRKKAEALIRHAARNDALAGAVRQAVLAAWDDVYATVRERKVGELLQLEAHAPWLADHCVRLLLPALSRPHVLRFLAAETALAKEASA